jgi:hypothetical protein
MLALQYTLTLYVAWCSRYEYVLEKRNSMADSFISLCINAKLIISASDFLRALPTAFNEKDQIFQAATINGVVSVVVIVLLAVFDLPTSSPNASVRDRPS